MMTVLRLAQSAQSLLPNKAYDKYTQAALDAAGRFPPGLGSWGPEAEEIQVQVSKEFSGYPEVVQNFRAFTQNLSYTYHVLHSS
ncbi:hypothetical protein BHE90_009843 [Fusarium euwallaceae]|uniref:Uncharacterized protein n=1 Tax=Fusarium euwallaceae TaxID=1147111 RepID=A0A430LJ26_9HYPO|nr:hypothetical protein BHE90_009843 [Fusarium euwallaceae]